ncbi:MAG: hypothetical protein ACFBSC_12780 [Microcoleaceae cyanobacterium]
MSDSNEQLWVVVEEPLEQNSIDGSRESEDRGGYYGVPRGLSNALKHRVPMDAAALKTQMNGLLRVVGDVFEQADQQTGMQLSEVTLSVEINGEGKVSLVGTGGTLGNRGGITLKFTRPQT